MQALPAAEQPEELQKLMKRGTARHLAELYGQMEEASAELVYRCRRHRRNRELFADPIRQICYLTSVFLEGCADPKTISDQNRINAFESFYTDQLKHRATLLKRIAGENAESFLELNMDYDLATVEKMELEAKKNRRKNEREAAARRKQEKAAQREINRNKYRPQNSSPGKAAPKGKPQDPLGCGAGSGEQWPGGNGGFAAGAPAFLPGLRRRGYRAGEIQQIPEKQRIQEVPLDDGKTDRRERHGQTAANSTARTGKWGRGSLFWAAGQLVRGYF